MFLRGIKKGALNVKNAKFLFVLAFLMVSVLTNFQVSFSRELVKDGDDYYCKGQDGEYVTNKLERNLVNDGDHYYFGEDGKMKTNSFVEDNDNYYYFGEDGKMVKSKWAYLASEDVGSGDEHTYIWFYFDNAGKAVKSQSGEVKKKEIDGKDYYFNNEGHLLIGWFDDNGEIISDDDENFLNAKYYSNDNGVAYSGWLNYQGNYGNTTQGSKVINDEDDVYFYFNPKNHKKVVSEDKTINKKRYAFDANGIMYSGWSYYEDHQAEGTKAHRYYDDSKEAKGKLIKKGWIYAKPSEILGVDTTDQEDEKVWFYLDGNGEPVKGQKKKIKDRYYCFDNDGIMQTGYVIFYNNKYFCSIDMEKTTGKDLIKKGAFYVKTKNRFVDVFAADYANFAYPPEFDSFKVQDGILYANFTTGPGSQPAGWYEARYKGYYDAFAEDIYGSNVDVTAGGGDPDVVCETGTYFLGLIREMGFTIQYFNEKGELPINKNAEVVFNDDTYIYKGNVVDSYDDIKSKVYYSLGIQLKANKELKYGLVALQKEDAVPGYPWGDMYRYSYARTDWAKNWINSRQVTPNMSIFGEMIARFFKNYCFSSIGTLGATGDGYQMAVVDVNGRAKKPGVYRDGNGNYWAVNKKGFFDGVYNIEVKYDKKGNLTWKTEVDETKNGKTTRKTKYMEHGFGDDPMNPAVVSTPSIAKPCTFAFGAGGQIPGKYYFYTDANSDILYNHQVPITDEYTLNFVADNENYLVREN